MTLHRNELVRITDLATTSDVIDGHDFESCHLVGPAVVAPLDNVHLEHNEIAGSLDALLLELPESTQQIGIIGLRNVTIRRCRLERIGIAGTPQFVMEFKFGSDSSPA